VDTTLALPGHALGVARARRFTARALTDWSLAHLADDAVLLVSELTTNAFLHGREPAALHLRADGAELRIAVSDADPRPPAMRKHGRTATTGRGLRMVDQLCSSWGTEPHDGGKRVWCTLPLQPRQDELGAFADFDMDAVEAL